MADRTLVYGPACNCDKPGPKITGYGSERAEVMAIGIAPGKNEIKQGRPFVGEAGKRFDSCLASCGFERDDVYCTNLCCIWKDAPEQSEIAQCWPRLKAEIELWQPRLILALGALASEWLTGYKVGKVRGGILRVPADLPPAMARLAECDIPDTTAVLPTWHPAATLAGRNPALVGDLIRDFRKIPRYLRGELDHPNVEAHVVQTREEAQQTLYWMSNREVALDVETTFDTPEAWGRLLCLSLATRLPPSQYCSEEKYVSYVFPRSILDPNRPLSWPTSIRWGFHNGPFDRNVLRRELGIDLPIAWDSMYQSYSCDERPGYDRDDRAGDSSGGGAGRNKAVGPGYHSLDQLGREYLNAGFFKDDTKDWIGQDPDQMIAGYNKQNPEVVPDDETVAIAREKLWCALYRRNALDAAYTVCLPQRLPVGQSAPCYRSLLLPTANAYADVQQAGIRVDIERLSALESDWRAAHQQMERDLEEWAGDLGFRNPPKRKRDLEGEPFNPASPAQLARLLFDPELLGLRARVRSAKTRAPSTAEAVLKDLLEEMDVAVANGADGGEGARFLRLLMRTRKYANTLKYLPIIRANLRPDGRVHPTFLPLVTGRYSAVDPPMQTFTQPYKLEADGVPELAALRSVIIPSEGMVLIARDYDQLEIHVGAWLSGDEQMKADLSLPFPESPDQKPDYHSRVCRDVLGCKAPYGSAEWSKTRRGAKVFTFGIEYGEGAAGLARHAMKETGAKFTTRRAEQIISAWYTRYARFAEWQKEQVRFARRHGYIENPFGFVRRFPLPDSVFDTQIKNCSIQGTASQHGTAAMIELVNGARYWNTESYLAGFASPDNRPLSHVGGQVLLTIHDEILAEVPESKLDEGQELLRAAMETPRIEGWPGMQTAPKWGRNWQDMHE